MSADPSTLYGVLEIRGEENALELATAFLFDRGCLGTEELPAAVGPGLQAYFPPGSDLRELLPELAQAVPGLRTRVEKPLPSRDWLAEWKRGLSGFALGERFYVVPTWLDSPEVSRMVLRIDPEQAFGTGTHETTRLCTELLERYVESGMQVLDIGTGTGILAMVAARLGAARVEGLEPDPAACRCARANVDRNDLRERVTVRGTAWASSVHVSRTDLVVANITSSVLGAIVRELTAPLLVLSGILVSELDAFTQSLPGHYRVAETRVAGEWAAVVARLR